MAKRKGPGRAVVWNRERIRKGGSKSYVFQYGHHLQLHHQPVEPHAAGVQGSRPRRRARKVRARGDMVDDAHADREISLERHALDVPGPAQYPGGQARRARSRHHADRRVPVLRLRVAARSAPGLLGLFAVDRGAVLVPAGLHGDGRPHGHQAVLGAGMPLSRIEHYLVLSDEIDATRDWYRDVLGMQEGWHPDFGFPVYWMYLEGVDVV